MIGSLGRSSSTYPMKSSSMCSYPSESGTKSQPWVGDAVRPTPSNKFETQLTADEGRRALKAFDRDVSLGFQDAIDLGAARLHTLG